MDVFFVSGTMKYLAGGAQSFYCSCWQSSVITWIVLSGLYRHSGLIKNRVLQNNNVMQYETFGGIQEYSSQIKKPYLSQCNHAPAFYRARWLAKATWHV